MSDDPSVTMLHNVRLSFPHLEQPHAPLGTNVHRYSADFILDPADPGNAREWEQLNAMVGVAAHEKWGENTEYVMEMLKTLAKQRDMGNGDDRRKKDMTILDGYKGMVYVKSRSQVKPTIVSADGKALEPLEAKASGEKMPYGGCYVNALVRLWLQDNQYGQGIRFELLGVQFVKDGPAFGPAPVEASDYFSPIKGAPEPAATATKKPSFF